MVYAVLGVLFRVPGKLKTFPLSEVCTALENSDVFPFGSVAVAVMIVVPEPAVSVGAFCKLLGPVLDELQFVFMFGPPVPSAIPSSAFPKMEFLLIRLLMPLLTFTPAPPLERIVFATVALS